MMSIEHTKDCIGEATGDECGPTVGSWDQPPGDAVNNAKDELDEDAPWCVIRRRAFELVSEEAAEEEAEGES